MSSESVCDVESQTLCHWDHGGTGSVFQGAFALKTAEELAFQDAGAQALLMKYFGWLSRILNFDFDES